MKVVHRLGPFAWPAIRANQGWAREEAMVARLDAEGTDAGRQRCHHWRPATAQFPTSFPHHPTATVVGQLGPASWGEGQPPLQGGSWPLAPLGKGPQPPTPSSLSQPRG